MNFKTMNEIELQVFIENANDFYYNKSESLVSDFEYDLAKDELRKRFPDNPILKTVGAKIENSSWKKAKHIIPMGSLNKINTFEELQELVNKWESSDVITVCVQEKLDGISLEILYENGKLIKGITRGDGYIGEDITSNVILMKGVKKNIDNFTGSIRGEIILLQEDFDQINKLQEKIGEDEYKNKRNAASGIAKNLEGKYCEWLTVLFYDLISEDKKFEIFTEYNKLIRLEELDLKTPNYYIMDCTYGYLVDIFNKYIEEVRPNLNYCIDGLVVKINDISLQREFGEKDLCPKGQIAWKFPNECRRTKLRLVDWQMGVTGRMTPVAIFDPINIGGALITRASLSNLDIFNSFNLHEEDEIMVARMNDVIPNVIKNYGGGTLTIGYPTICPYCQEKLLIGSKFLTCENEFCSGNILGNLKKWADSVFEEKGMGHQTVILMFEHGLIKEPADFYVVTKSDLLKLPKFGNKKAENILEVIKKGKNITLPKFIGGLNMKNFGKSRTELLMENGFDTLSKIMEITENDLRNIKGLGDVIINSFQTSIKDKETVINNLIDVGIDIVTEPILKTVSGGLMQGEVYCFTGKIEKLDEEGNRYTRKKMEKLVLDNGGEIGDVKKNLTYLVQADPDSESDKSKKAKSLGVKIMSEKEFFEKLGL